MKKVFLVLALMALVVVSCKNVETPASVSTPDSTAVQVDSVSVDSASLEVSEVDSTKTVK
jgi:outer membrane lipoprotein SlyB